MSGVMRISFRLRRFWRMISWPAAVGMRCVKPSSASVWPSFTKRRTASARGMIRDSIIGPSAFRGIEETSDEPRIFHGLLVGGQVCGTVDDGELRIGDAGG